MKYRWDKERQVYVDEEDKVVTSRSLHALLNILIGKVSERFAEIEDDRARGRISNPEAQIRSQREIGLANRMMSALGWGGLRHIPEPARTSADAKVRLEVAFWLRFEAERPQLSEDQARARAQLYAGGIWAAFEQASRAAHRSVGYTHARWVLEAGADHCEDCPEQARRGALPVEEFPRLGSLRCLANCRCHLAYVRQEVAAQEVA